MLEKKYARSVHLFVAALVAILTTAVVARATQTITTPNAMSVSYTLVPGADSAVITPVSGQPVLVLGCQLNVNYRGVSQVTLLRIASNFLEWVGLESTAGAAITQGFSGTAGAHILWLDYSHTVDIQVASPDTFKVHNANANTMSGTIRMIW